MKPPSIRILLGLCFSLAWLAACSRNEPPPPLAVEEVPASLESTFEEAAPEARNAANEVARFVQEKNDVKAFFEIENLSTRSDLTPEQRAMAGRSRAAISQRLQQAAAQGDQQAAEAIELYRSRK